MKPFNLEEALAGKPVITRDGRKVTQLTKLDNKNDFCIVGVVDNGIEIWNLKGEYDGFPDSKFDLFMKTEKKSIWVNVYEYESDISFGNIFLTKTEAVSKINKFNKDTYIKTIEITNEK